MWQAIATLSEKPPVESPWLWASKMPTLSFMGVGMGKKIDGFAKFFFISMPLSDLNINLVAIKQCNLSLMTRQSSPMELSKTFFLFAGSILKTVYTIGNER